MLNTLAGVSIHDGGSPARSGAGEIDRENNDDADFGFGHSVGTAEAVEICDGIIDLLAVFFNVSGRQLRSSKRTVKPVSRIRQIGMYVAHVTLGLKMVAVGAGFGRDKSTVVHACHTIEDMRDDEDFNVIVSRVEHLVTIAFSLNCRSEQRNV